MSSTLQYLMSWILKNRTAPLCAVGLFSCLLLRNFRETNPQKMCFYFCRIFFFFSFFFFSCLEINYMQHAAIQHGISCFDFMCFLIYFYIFVTELWFFLNLVFKSYTVWSAIQAAPCFDVLPCSKAVVCVCNYYVCITVYIDSTCVFGLCLKSDLGMVLQEKCFRMCVELL